jgi:hypothetical protein
VRPVLIVMLDTSEAEARVAVDSTCELVRALGGEIAIGTTADGRQVLQVRLDAAGLERLGVALALAGATDWPGSNAMPGRSKLLIVATQHS